EPRALARYIPVSKILELSILRMLVLTFGGCKPLLRSSRTAADRLGIRCRNQNSSMAFSSSRGISTCRRSFFLRVNVTLIFEMQITQMKTEVLNFWLVQNSFKSDNFIRKGALVE